MEPSSNSVDQSVSIQFLTVAEVEVLKAYRKSVVFQEFLKSHGLVENQEGRTFRTPSQKRKDSSLVRNLFPPDENEAFMNPIHVWNEFEPFDYDDDVTHISESTTNSFNENGTEFGLFYEVMGQANRIRRSFQPNIN